MATLGHQEVGNITHLSIKVTPGRDGVDVDDCSLHICSHLTSLTSLRIGIARAWNGQNWVTSANFKHPIRACLALQDLSLVAEKGIVDMELHPFSEIIKPYSASLRSLRLRNTVVNTTSAGNWIKDVLRHSNCDLPMLERFEMTVKKERLGQRAKALPETFAQQHGVLEESGSWDFGAVAFEALKNTVQ
jgi:hypothetical protein